MRIAVLPARTSLADLAGVPGAALGLLSAGIGPVPAAQTYLDLGQGNRLNRSLYDRGVPRPAFEAARRGVDRIDPVAWRKVVERASAAPAELVPGLLASSLRRADIPVRASASAGPAGLLAADERGRVRVGGSCGPGCRGLDVVAWSLAEARAHARRLTGEDLLIAFAKPPPARGRELPVAIVGAGFDGQLTSESTHLDGLVLTTDLTATVLARFGVAAPGEVAGQPVEAAGSADAGALAELETRLAEVGPRRHVAVGVNLIIWGAAALLAVALFRSRGARVALPLLAATLAFAPATMLVAPVFHPSVLAERLIVGAGAPALALASVAVAGAWGALALGALLSVGGYAVDVVAGSNLTGQSLMGPNPALGVRFYGIGNELEAMIVALSMLGTGAAITAWAPGMERRRGAWAFALVGLAGVVAFAPGRFGADVGAAIDLPAAAAAAVAVCLGARRSRALLMVAVPLVALGLLAGVDLATGGDSHLTRSVLQAGGLHSLADVAQRRLRLSAMSYTHYAVNPALWLTLAFAIAAVVRRDRIRAWLAGRELAWAGLVAAAAGTVVGTMANDSGALLFMIGGTYVAMGVAVAYATRPGPAPALASTAAEELR